MIELLTTTGLGSCLLLTAVTVYLVTLALGKDNQQ